MRLLLLTVACLLTPFCVSRPKYGMLVLIVFQATLLGGSAELETNKFIFGGLFGLQLLWWIPRMLRTRQQWIKQPLAQWVTGLFLLFAVSRLVGMAHGISALDWFRDLSPMLNYVWILMGVAAFGAGKNTRGYCKLLLFFLAILSVISTAQLLSFRDFLSGPIAFFDSINVTPIVILFGVFLALSLASDDTQVRSRKQYWIIASGFVACGLLTGTRTNSISIFAGLATYTWLLGREGMIKPSKVVIKTVLPFAVVTGLFLMTVAYGFLDTGKLFERYKEPFSEDFLEDATLTNRIAEGVDAWNAFTASPIVGQGLGYKMPTVFQLGMEYYTPEMYFVHNFYFYVLAKFGLLGIVTFAGFFVSVIRTSIRGYFRSAPGINKGLYAGVACLMVALIVESITAAQFNERFPTAFLGVLLGMIIAMEVENRMSIKKLAVPLPVLPDQSSYRI